MNVTTPRRASFQRQDITRNAHRAHNALHVVHHRKGVDFRRKLTPDAHPLGARILPCPRVVTQRTRNSTSGGMTPRATTPVLTALPGENLGSVDGPGERVGRIDRVMQQDPERAERLVRAGQGWVQLHRCRSAPPGRQLHDEVLLLSPRQRTTPPPTMRVRHCCAASRSMQTVEAAGKAAIRPTDQLCGGPRSAAQAGGTARPADAASPTAPSRTRRLASWSRTHTRSRRELAAERALFVDCPQLAGSA